MAKARVPFGERYRTSRAILRESLQLVRRERHLWAFPIATSLLMVVAMAGAVAVGIYVAAGDDTLPGFARLGPWAGAVMFAVLLPIIYPLSIVASLGQAAYAYGLHQRMNGRRCTRRQAWQRARAHTGAIARFALIALLVGGVLAVLGALLDKLRLVPGLGRAFQVVGSFGWAVAAFFVIPVIVVERERRALDALRTSVQLAREQWGKSVAGIVTISLALLLPFAIVGGLLLLAMALAVPMVIATGSFGLMLPIMLSIGGLFILLALAMAVASSLVTAAYQTALYSFARTGKVPKPFTRATVVDAWAPYRQ